MKPAPPSFLFRSSIEMDRHRWISNDRLLSNLDFVHRFSFFFFEASVDHVQHLVREQLRRSAKTAASPAPQTLRGEPLHQLFALHRVIRNAVPGSGRNVILEVLERVHVLVLLPNVVPQREPKSIHRMRHELHPHEQKVKTRLVLRGKVLQHWVGLEVPDVREQSRAIQLVVVVHVVPEPVVQNALLRLELRNQICAVLRVTGQQRFHLRCPQAF
mmetsp:Transcript_77/g.150  ORF Transcript_77/g.150 Transcript_77/m.150 type:complete len:215 (-) Transcript_77:2282-2926(-)